MSKEVVIKSIDGKMLEFPVCLSIDTDISSSLYTSLCILRNNLIENGIINKDLRYRMYFYKKIEGNLIKIKEGDKLEGVIYLGIEDENDYSEPVNILYHLEKRITEFEIEFKELYNNNKDNINFLKLKKLWYEFRDKNSDCFDYAEWYFVMKPIKGEIQLLNKMALDIRKWLIQKDKIISELNIIYLNKINYKEGENDYDLISKFLYDV